MVLALLMGLSKSGGDDAYSIASESIGYEQQVALYHADGTKAVLSIVITVVKLQYGKRVVEHIACHLEL
jgi:hypothetical protein